jgi:hypothetical protein
MSSEISDPPEPRIDEEPERAPGGADADLNESDVGAASSGRPVTPDVPLSAQQVEEQVPDEIQTKEPPEVPEDGSGDPETSAEPSA